MSGCLRISSDEMPRMARTGTITARVSQLRSTRRVRRSAAKTMSASFISSEGWIRNWPNPIHRDDPPAVTPRPGTRTATSRAMVPISSGTRMVRHFR